MNIQPIPTSLSPVSTRFSFLTPFPSSCPSLQVRHGQYVEGGKEDASQVLTELGRRQAELTGKRLAAYLPEGACWKVMHQSDMIRAKETAAIIASHLPQVVPLNAPNPLLNEGYPVPI
jgi:serine/threonine-protein phosphatase PGAM5